MAEYFLFRRVQTPAQSTVTNGTASGSVAASGSAVGIESPPPVTDHGTWSEVQLGQGNLANARRIVTPSVGMYPNPTGVSFWKDDVFNRTDATGPNENSVYHFYPLIDLVGGEVLRAEWTDVNGVARQSIYNVPPPVPVAPTATGSIGVTGFAFQPGAVPAPGSMGPSGQWPTGFPTYATAADIVTNGSLASLRSALDSLPSGGVIEHPGNISGDSAGFKLRRSSGGGTITVRPPIGQRDNYSIQLTQNVECSNVVFAGFRLASKFYFERGANRLNVGLAWCEANAGTEVRALGYDAGITMTPFLYEVIWRNPKTSGDRIVFHAQNAGVNINAKIVGCWIAGTHDPAPGDHADTIQIINLSGGKATCEISDSVVWSSDDKALQGAGRDNSPPEYTLDNVWIASPSYTKSAWAQMHGGFQLIVGGFHATAANFTLANGVILGTVNSSADAQGNTFTRLVSNSTTYQNGGTLQDGGGNTEAGSLPLPPAAPDPALLDQIWSP